MCLNADEKELVQKERLKIQERKRMINREICEEARSWNPESKHMDWSQTGGRQLLYVPGRKTKAQLQWDL